MKDPNKIYYSSQNRCPICGCTELEWIHSEAIDEGYLYEFRCPTCGTEGSEWCNIVYTHTEIEKIGNKTWDAEENESIQK